MSRLCEGRVAIVTGGGGGIGREHALMLAQHGAKVVVNDLGTARDGSGRDVSAAQSVADEIVAAGGEAVANGDDVSDWTGAKNLVAQAVTSFGKLDVLINNAGILRDRMLVNMTEEEWDAVIKVHLKGTFAPSHHAANHWRERNKQTGKPVNARIINTSSGSGLFGNVGQANYGAAKAGIAAFSIIAARELSRYGVTVNAVSPHAQTRMTEGLRPRSEDEKARRHPRFVSPIVVWLASEQSAGVTARIFDSGAGKVYVMEGWRLGPEAPQEADPVALGQVVPDIIARARKNSNMLGQELD